MTDSDKTTGANLSDITFTSVWSEQPTSAAKHTVKSRSAPTSESCCSQCPGTLILVIVAFICVVPAGSIAFYYYKREEKCKAVVISIFGIILGTLASVVLIIVLSVFLRAAIAS